jgi:hypothetical protein
MLISLLTQISSYVTSNLANPLIYLVLLLAIVVLVARMKMYHKMGLHSILAIIPIANSFTLAHAVYDLMFAFIILLCYIASFGCIAAAYSQHTYSLLKASISISFVIYILEASAVSKATEGFGKNIIYRIAAYIPGINYLIICLLGYAPNTIYMRGAKTLKEMGVATGTYYAETGLFGQDTYNPSTQDLQFDPQQQYVMPQTAPYMAAQTMEPYPQTVCLDEAPPQVQPEMVTYTNTDTQIYDQPTFVSNAQPELVAQPVQQTFVASNYDQYGPATQDLFATMQTMPTFADMEPTYEVTGQLGATVPVQEQVTNMYTMPAHATILTEETVAEPSESVTPVAATSEPAESAFASDPDYAEFLAFKQFKAMQNASGTESEAEKEPDKYEAELNAAMEKIEAEKKQEEDRYTSKGTTSTLSRRQRYADNAADEEQLATVKSTSSASVPRREIREVHRVSGRSTSARDTEISSDFQSILSKKKEEQKQKNPYLDMLDD